MSYIHKITGDVYHDIQSDDARDDFFECDELIAPIISILNKKGFKTQFCCSGHAYPTIDDYYAKETSKIDLTKDRIGKIITSHGDDTITKISKVNLVADASPFSTNFTIVEHEEMKNVTYIYFDRELPWSYFPPLPKGWVIELAPCGDGDVIRYDGPWKGLNLNIDGFEKLEMIFKAMKELYKWAISLDYYGAYIDKMYKDARNQLPSETEEE